MARVNFRQVQHRFQHIDARFEGCDMRIPGDGSFSVRLYPWWEHPLYLEAVKRGSSWGFNEVPDEAFMLLTVCPIDIQEVSISRTSEVTEWAFTKEDPVLWPYEDAGQIFANEPIAPSVWLDIVQSALRRLPRGPALDRCHSWLALDQVLRFGNSSSFSLGSFPRPLFVAIRNVLENLGIGHFIERVPEPVDLPVALVMDDGDFIVARDFELEVPEFSHSSHWFRPRGRSA